MNPVGNGSNTASHVWRWLRCAAFIAFLTVAFAISTVPATSAQVADRLKKQRSCRDFVQQFYDWHISREVLDEKFPAGRTTSDDVLRLRPHVLSPLLLRLLKEDSAAQAKADEIVGLDFDPFFASQDPSSKFEVERVTMKDGHCHAVVNGIERGEKRERVMPELVETGEKWVFVNFHYDFNSEVGKPPVDEDLIDLLKRLSKDRTKPLG
jgi:hypothetical protein